ncbi:hypothetical protein [Candidatus Allofournierella excrementavium]|uniref:hypothetical protein n=1 Tax=Candidatus Allofournierella excrementavium TaxID=2838591 RepID=UPI003AEF4D48
MKRKLLTLALCAALALCALPMAAFAEGPATDNLDFGENNTVYYAGSYYPTLAEALTEVYKSKPQGTAEVICRPDADVGPMPHGHVADDLVIYGNGARVSGGEKDLEIDTYQYDRTTGKQSESGDFLDKDITVTVYDLEGIAAWGERHTDRTVNLYFSGCKNMQRVYFTNNSNSEGKLNITLEGCSFDAAGGSNVNTAVYTNAPGEIDIRNTTFTNIAVGLNINHKSNGVQNILLEGCTFTDCALPDVSAAQNTKTYGAPVRIVAKEGATTHLTVNGTTFNYSDGKTNCGNGDILLGDGRHDAASQQGTVTLAMTGTAAQVMVQQAGYYNDAGTVAGQDKGKTTTVLDTDVVLADPNSHFVVKRDPVVQIGDTGYGTLEEAMEAAKAMTGDVTVTVLKDIQVKDSTYDLSGTGLTSLTLQGKTGAEKLISGVNGNDIDGSTYCPVIRVKLPANAAGLTVTGLVFPNDLLFDSEGGRVLVKNCTFNGAKSGYPQAAAIRYEGNLFEFKGTAGNFYSQNAYPVWYKVDKPLDFDFVGNTVIGYRGVHIETRGDDAVAADIQVDKNTFRLSDSQNPSKAVALQLVSNIRGKVSFVDNNVDGYMGVCFYNGVKVGDDAAITVGNNYLADGTKLYGVSEWNAPNGDVPAAEEKLQAQLKGKATIDATHTHTHTYQNGVCTVCGAQEPRPDPKPDAPAATPAPAPVLDSTPKTGAVSLVALPLAALALAGVGVALRKRH